MLDRVIVAIGLVVLGVVAYHVMVAAQHRVVARGSKSGTMSERAALLVFTSPTCAPCKLQQLPIVDRLLVEWSDKIDKHVVDVTEQPDVAKQYGVWSLPTTIVLKADRSVVAINQGVAHAAKLREQFERATTNGPRSNESKRQRMSVAG